MGELASEVEIGRDCVIPDDSKLEAGVLLGARVVLAGPNIAIGKGAVVEAGSIIGSDVVIGPGALVRPGAVVLSSVPPNAIVEGNPAQVVGYVDSSIVRKSTSSLVDVNVFAERSAPARYALDVGSSALHLMRQVSDTRGSLTVGEVASELPFRPERYFLVYDVPSAELRGEHAHKECEQFLVCTHGSCRVMLDDGSRRCEVLLDRPNLGVFMPAMIWGTQYKYSPDAVLLVFASLPYDAGDYIRTYEQFLAELQRQKSS